MSTGKASFGHAVKTSVRIIKVEEKRINTLLSHMYIYIYIYICGVALEGATETKMNNSCITITTRLQHNLWMHIYASTGTDILRISSPVSNISLKIHRLSNLHFLRILSLATYDCFTRNGCPSVLKT